MQNAVVRFVFHLRLSNHVFKEAVIVLLMVMEEVWRILPAPQNSLSKSHIISVSERLSYRRDGSNNIKWL